MIGSFGYGKSTYGGEDVKNRLLRKYLNKLGHNIGALDTSGWRGGILATIWKILYRTVTSRENIFLCSHAIGAIKVLPYLLLYKFLFRRKVIYMVVGFQINEYVNNYPITVNILSNLDAVIVETEMHKNFLSSKGLTNVKHINNFRDIKNNKNREINKSRRNQFEIIYFTRIDKRKPIDGAMLLMDQIKQMNLQEKYRLNIYGKLHEEYKEKFYSKISEYDNVEYHGSIDAEQIVNTLMRHDAMVYPLEAKEDVFPGVLLDAFRSKLPVIAKDSNYISEIIRDNVNGFLITSNKGKKWVEKLEQLRKMDDQDYFSLIESTYTNALRFDSETVLNDFVQLLIKQEVI